MGACFSKKTKTTTTPPPLNPDHPPTTNDPQLIKKEIFFIRHRVSHQNSDQQNPSPTTRIGPTLTTSAHSNQDVDSILAQCHNMLRRNNSVGAQNPIRRRRCSCSKRSFDLGFNSNTITNNNKGGDEDSNNDDEDDEQNHHHRHRHRNRQPQNEVRVSSSIGSISKERRISISPSRRSSSKERRISISPSRRFESPVRSSNSNPTVSANSGGSNKPAKMVSVPATDKSNNAGGVQQVPVGAVNRIHVKRNVSPARTNFQVFTDSQRAEREIATRDRRKSLAEIDNNAARSAPLRDTRRTRKISRDLDMSPERIIDCDQSVSPSTNPVSYASLLLEDIKNFHKKKRSAAATAATPSPSFALPECVSKACLIMEAVADLNSSTTSLCLDERWRNPSSLKKDDSV